MMANENIGVLDCPMCGGLAHVRKYVNGRKLYFVDACGIMRPAMEPGQAWIRAHMRPLPEAAPPPPDPPPAAPAPAAEPAPEKPKPKEKRRSILAPWGE
ncbi:MAG: hypothetical protein ACYCOR_19205 [Acidobacteriaceae bacterium]